MESCEGNGNFADIPLCALGLKARDILSKQLDKLKVIPSSDGLPRDYRGLAEVAGVGCNDIRNPTQGVIVQWSAAKPSPTFRDLVESLGRLDRWDVVTDVEPVLQADALNYTLTLRQIAVSNQRHQSSTSESNIVTYDDADLVRIGLPPNQRYDAYLLYADQDEEIAKDIVYKLEQQYHLKICVKDRDIIPGAGFEHEAITYLISERCNWLIVVLTPDFIDCPAQKFIYNYSVALGLSERRNKIIPCLFKVSSDETINMKLRKVTYSVLPVNFTRRNPFRSNWEQLSGAVAAPRPLATNNLRAIEPTPALEAIGENLPATENKNPIDVQDQTSLKKALVDVPSVSKQVPDRPPRSKDKQMPDTSLQNGTVNLDSPKHSSEISKESCSSNNSTALLLPLQPNKTQSSYTKIVNNLKKTKIGKTCKNMLKKTKKKKIAEALPS